MLNGKRLLSLTLALLMVCSLLPTAIFAKDTCDHEWVWDEEEGPFYQWCDLCDEEQELEEILGGYKGYSARWRLTPDGTLTVYGEGDVNTKGELPNYSDYVTALVIEAGITDIYLPGEFANLSTITVDKDNPRYYVVDNVLFDRDENLLVIYPQQKQDATYTVPGCSIDGWAFYGNKHLESVTVEEGTVFLGKWAFGNCKNLTELSLPLSLEEVQQRALPGTLETIRYPGNETQWNRVYIHPGNDLEDAEVVFGVPKSDIDAQWNLLHTVLSLKGDAPDAAYVVVNFYQSNGQMVKTNLYTAAQIAAGVDILSDDGTDFSTCSAKIMVLDSAFAPIYDCTVPDGDVDHAALATFEGVMYQVDDFFRLKTFDEAEARRGELLFSNGEDVLVVDTVRMFDLSYRDLGQRYTVTYNWQTNDLVSLENTGVSVVGTARLDEVEYRAVTENDTKTYLFTFGKLEELPFDGDSVPYLKIDNGSAGRGTYSAEKMAEKTYSASADEYTAVDSDNDGDIDGLFIHVMQYAQVTRHGTDKKKGDYMDLMFVDDAKAGRYYLGDDLFGPDKLPDDLKDGDIIKIFWGWDDADTYWEILPSETMTFEKLSTTKGRYTFDGNPFRLAENGWDLSDSLINANLGRDFTIAYDGDLLVWAEAELVPLDAAKIYGDGDQIDPDAKDAVELMYALGLMKGDENGNFNPEGTVTRAEMAKMIYFILNYGEDDGAKNFTGGSLFSDVESGAWYEGYVNYCAMTKLIQGQSDGTFGPNEPLTCAKAAKMLLTAIGYSAESRGYVGENWEANALSDAAIIGLLDGYTYNVNSAAPRQWLAKMIENCLLKCYTYDNPYDKPDFSGLLTGPNEELILMGEKYFDLTKDSEIYRMVYADTDASATLTFKTTAAEVVNFADSMDAFEALGGNDNASIVIDSLPTYGRLVYKWGTAQQEEVEADMKFYLYRADMRLLSDVTYVPAYSADKTDKTDSFAVTVKNADRTEVEGTVNITIRHAQKSAQFTDVTDSYYADSVDFVYNQKISTGMTATTFGLTGNVTRGQFATFLFRAAGSPYITGVTNNFTDVSTSDYYYNAVMWSVSNNLVNGVSSNEFNPTGTLTREQTLTLLYRFAVNYLGRDTALGDPDGITDYADVGEWAQVPVRWAVAHGFVGDGALEPESFLDRGTTAIYLHGALTGMAGATQPDPEPETEPYTALVYGIAVNTPPDHIELDAIAPDGTKKALTVTEADGEPVTDAALITLPAFYEVTDNDDGTVSLSHITGDFAKHGIYAGQVNKYTYKTETVTLNSGVELTESSDGFTLYNGNFEVELNTLASVSRKTDYIFFAPEEEVIYGIRADKQALQKLFVRLGGLQDSAAKYGDSYFLDPDAREAISLLYELDIMKGDVGGNFNPESPVPRAVMAKMIYFILNYGEDDKGEDYVGMNFFTDVDGEWYEGYANYCAANGLMGGNADGTFAPYETVTFPQAAKILLMAMGYDSETRGYVGANWADAVLSDAAILGLLEDCNCNTNSQITRQWLAQMVFNALTKCYTYVTYTPDLFTALVTPDVGTASPKKYILMGDKYFDLGLWLDLPLVLLTDAYYDHNRNGKVYAVEAYLDGEYWDVDVDPDSEIAAFIDDSDINNSWGRLIPYAGDEKATTNVAAYTMDADGVMSLYQPRKTVIDLYEDDAEASQKSYYGDYTDENGELLEDVSVQMNQNTVYYYVDAERNVEIVTGYKNSYAVTDAKHGIRAMYAVATNVETNMEYDPYFVADVVVIETEKSVLSPESTVTLGYSATNKIVSDYIVLDAIASDGTEETLAVIQLDGENAKDAQFHTPAFYEATENANGYTSLTTIAGDYTDYGIYAGTVDRAQKLYDYVVLEDGTTLYDVDTVVYRLHIGARYTSATTEDENGGTLTLEKGESYILVVDEDDYILYAIWVQDADDPAAALYAEICGKPLATPTATITINSPVDVFVDGVAYTAPIEAKTGDVLTLKFASEVIVSATGATCTMGETFQIWTITVNENTVTIAAAQ